MEKKIKELTELLKETVEGKCAIALAGAHAKGAADAASDIDLYIFAERAKPYYQRLALIRDAADPETTPWIDQEFDAAPWGGGMDFMYRGTPVEVVGRTLKRMDHVVEDCLHGKFDIIPATWTSNGYYTFIYLCELSFLKPVWDPDGILDIYQQKAAIYPEPLRRAIVETFMGRAGTWIENFHYSSAVRRGDVLFTAPIVLHTVMDMIQVVFALNRVYFTGDKKLETALAKMPFCPDALRPAGLNCLLTAKKDPAHLEQQRQLLRQAWDELSRKVRAVSD
ncbi:MAG: DUF4037 domain-containing protein [Oscillospiraceae bacterium]|nr:DUF4037 domain-containing protein [Oscillospiraceae bacterium]